MAPSGGSEELHWYCPKERGIIPLEGVHMPRRLLRTILQERFEIRTDTAFETVMRACAAPAPGREETWISPVIIELYSQLHKMGHAHSVEVWDGQNRLVGGLYGVSLGSAFFGESMFSLRRDVSKIALMHLVAGLRKGGYHLLDTQYITSHLGSFGAVTVPFGQYRLLLGVALAQKGIWPDCMDLQALRAFLPGMEEKESRR